MNQFCFLMCSERSGSNFITKLMNGHSRICGPSTKHLFNPVARNLFRYEPLNNKSNWNELLKDIYRLLSIDFSVWKISFSIEELEKLAPVGDIETLLRNIFLKEAEANGKDFVFVKENQVYEFMNFLIMNFPDAKYVYEVRDPRDMALSWKKNPAHHGGVVKAAKRWKYDQQNYLKWHYELKKNNQSYLIRYENLIESPEMYLKEISTFLGFDYEPKMLEFYKDSLTRENASKQPAWENLSKSILNNNKNKYIKELSEIEIRLIEAICWHEMAYFGYELENMVVVLEDISDDVINDYSKKEIENIKWLIPEHIQRNMRAKKVFYTKKID